MSPLSKAEQVIYDKAFAAGVAAGKPRRWTDAEVKTLLEWAGTDKALAERLGRTHMAVRLKRYKINKGEN